MTLHIINIYVQLTICQEIHNNTTFSKLNCILLSMLSKLTMMYLSLSHRFCSWPNPIACIISCASTAWYRQPSFCTDSCWNPVLSQVSLPTLEKHLKILINFRSCLTCKFSKTNIFFTVSLLSGFYWMMHHNWGMHSFWMYSSVIAM